MLQNAKKSRGSTIILSQVYLFNVAVLREVGDITYNLKTIKIK